MISRGDLGKVFENGETIISQGEHGDCMYVIQQGRVEVLLERPGSNTRVAVLEAGDVFGEMALFAKAPRSATVRALGQARILTINRRGFMKRIHQDPSLAFRILQMMSTRIKALDEELVQLRRKCANDHMTHNLTAV